LHFLFLFVIFAITATAAAISMYLSEIFFLTLVFELLQIHHLG
jgi:hypothetical protein